MIWDVLLKAVLNTFIGIMAKVGLEKELEELKDRLTKAGDKQLKGAFARAFNKAVKGSGDEEIKDLLKLKWFQEQVLAKLIDPEQRFDFHSIAEHFGGRYPRHQIMINKFFSDLQYALMLDETWGPILNRFQEIRFRDDVIQTLRKNKLQDNLSALDLVHRLNTHLTGSGAIAQDGSVAAGEGGIAIGGEGYIEKLVQAENYTEIEKQIQVIIQELTIKIPERTEISSSRNTYLTELAKDADLLPWGKVSHVYADPDSGEDIGLSDIYTDLDTMELRHIEREEELREFIARMHEMKRIPAQEIADNKQRLIILGDPGSGKSTFVKHLAFVMANSNLSKDPSLCLKGLNPWNHDALFPLFMELRKVAAFAGEKERCEADAALLLDYIQNMLNKAHLEDFWPWLCNAIRAEEDKEGSLLILLDGLDEVPKDQRGLIMETVNEFTRRYCRHRYIITCRPYAYIGSSCRLNGFREVTLAPFNEEQINRFVKNWYERLVLRNRIARGEAQKRLEHLQHALRRPELKELAERPLILTVMSQLYTFKGQLPEDRAALYEDAVELLLERWEGRLGKDTGVLKRLGIPGLKMSTLKAGLYEVAFNAHAGQGDAETADIKEGDLREWLAPHLGGDWNKAGDFVDYIRERAGLLIRHKTDAYTFPHRTFQEFMAACHLSGIREYTRVASDLVNKDINRWREVFLLSVGYNTRISKKSDAIDAVNVLCPRDVEKVPKNDLHQWEIVQLAGEALLEIDLRNVKKDEVGESLLDRVGHWLLAAMRCDCSGERGLAVLPSKERAEAGRTLAKLGDPRKEVCLPEEMIFCKIPAGPFIIGSKGDSMAREEERPQHTCNIPYDYCISKYPVTNAQFKAFVDAGGYRDRRYWHEAEKIGYWKDGMIKGIRYDPKQNEFIEEYVDSPVNPGDPFSLLNHPVVNVNWFEALAFTRWLTELLKKVKKLPEGWKVHLPSEAEWEKAARGKDGRIFPWGNEEDPNRANYDKTGIYTTSPVGCFPGGASAYDVEDLSGNVWEWTRSLWGKSWDKTDFGYPYDPMDLKREELDAPANIMRVLRGGAFLSDEYNVRCAFRGRSNPSDRYGIYGFCVVASPFTSEL